MTVVQGVKVPRFRWNKKANGRVINKYIDMLARDFPSIAKEVAKKGIKGDLGNWFQKGPDDAGFGIGPTDATCGCLVGTTCLVAMKKNPAVAGKVDIEGEDGAVVLYKWIVAKTKRDVSKWYPEGLENTTLYSSSAEHSDANEHDPLFILISKAGYAAAEEAAPLGEEWAEFNVATKYDGTAEKIRNQQVVDKIEHRIREKLNIPYPKRKNAKAKSV